MEFSKIEDVMYLARVNLFFEAFGSFHDWTEAKVKRIENNQVVLDVSFDQNWTEDEATFDLDELADYCRKLCEEHFAALRTFRKEGEAE